MEILKPFLKRGQTETGCRRYCKGNRTDNIPGLVGVGPKTAEKILGDSETLSDMWDKVIGAYEKRKLTYKSALLSARLTRILRHGEYNLNKQEVKLWNPPHD